MERLPQLDFASVLASSIHDMKNSLGMLLGDLDGLQQQVGNAAPQVDAIRHQSRRLNNQLMQLLNLYKMQRGLSSPVLDWQAADELLEDAAADHAPLLAAQGIRISVAPVGPVNLCCDRDLVLGVLDNALTNAFRYVRSCIELSAQPWPHARGEGVVLSLRDDGPGFPAAAHVDPEQGLRGEQIRRGRSGLGLYFCAQVAALHQQHGIQGQIACDNQGLNGGGRFRLFLP